jgi:hypothetical protein
MALVSRTLFTGERPTLTLQIVDWDNGDPINITGATVSVGIRKEGAGANAWTLVGVLTDPTNGKFTVTFPANFLSGDIGLYRAQAKVIIGIETRITEYFDLAIEEGVV